MKIIKVPRGMLGNESKKMNLILQAKTWLLKAAGHLRPESAKTLYSKYEPYFSPLALATGFVIDNLTLRRIDLWAENLVIIIYLSLALLSIVYLSAYEAGRLERNSLVKLANFAPFVLQFTFGGLFSVFFVFYNRSASLAASWPFLLTILALLVGNESFRERYQRLAFRLSVFFMALFSYSVLGLPVLLKSISTGVFILSGILAWLLLGLSAFLVYKAAPEAFKKSRVALLASTVSIYLLFNFFYFANLIPPIPLAVKESGVYHSLVRAGDHYDISYEPAPWYMLWRDHNPIFHWETGDKVVYYSAIFAPTDFNLEILHHWQYYNEEEREWQSVSLLSFPIVGGRDGGYRGYSYKYNVWPGKWRIDTITETGRIMGRTDFEIQEADGPVELETGMR